MTTKRWHIDKCFFREKVSFVIINVKEQRQKKTLEQKLSKYYSSEFIISSLSNDKLGDEVVIVFKENIPENYKDAFKKLDKYEVPKKVFLLDTFPKNNGKINRNQIKNNININ